MKKNSENNERKIEMNKRIKMKEYIYGKHIVRMAIERDQVIELYLQSENNEFINLSESNNIPYKIVSKEKIYGLVSNYNHQGIVAKIKKFGYLNIEELLQIVEKNFEKKRIIILDKIKDSANFGSILRNIKAFNFSGVIIGQHDQVLVNSAVHKTSVGTTFDVNICLVNNINNAIKILKKEGYWILATDSSANKSISDIDKNVSYGIILGSEEKGVSMLTSKLSDINVRIPISSDLNSLNVSVASGILMYELSKDDN